MISVDFEKLWRTHLSRDKFLKNKGKVVYLRYKREKYSLARLQYNTCALRVSYALFACGVKQPTVSSNWFYSGKYNRYKKTYLVAGARQYRNFYYPKHRQWIKKRKEPKLRQSKLGGLLNKKGIIFFGGGPSLSDVSGHVTLWWGNRCHYNDFYKDAAEIVFWELGR